MAIYMMREYVMPDYLCFTANEAGKWVKLVQNGSPTSVTLETSTDGQTWTTYTIGNTITLTNIGDKVYWRNTSETDTGFNTSNTNRYTFNYNGSFAVSGDVTYLLNKNGTTTLSTYCFARLFYNGSYITSAPKIPATTIGDTSCYQMFYNCSNLEQLPALHSLSLGNTCYRQMFSGCSKIKLSTTKTGDYQTEYRIPITGTGATGTNSLTDMFSGTGGTFTGTPTINTTYYTSNTVV